MGGKLRSDVLLIPTVSTARDRPQVGRWPLFCSMLHTHHSQMLLYFDNWSYCMRRDSQSRRKAHLWEEKGRSVWFDRALNTKELL